MRAMAIGLGFLLVSVSMGGVPATHRADLVSECEAETARAISPIPLTRLYLKRIEADGNHRRIAEVSFELAGQLVVHKAYLIDGRDHFFVAMPQDGTPRLREVPRSADSSEPSFRLKAIEVAHPVDARVREALETSAQRAYAALRQNGKNEMVVVYPWVEGTPLKVTEVRITPGILGQPVLAFANVTFNDAFAIRSIRLLRTQDGIKVAMPTSWLSWQNSPLLVAANALAPFREREKMDDGGKPLFWRPIYHASKLALREALEERVQQAWQDQAWITGLEIFGLASNNPLLGAHVSFAYGQDLRGAKLFRDESGALDVMFDSLEARWVWDFIRHQNPKAKEELLSRMTVAYAHLNAKSTDVDTLYADPSLREGVRAWAQNATVKLAQETGAKWYIEFEKGPRLKALRASISHDEVLFDFSGVEDAAFWKLAFGVSRDFSSRVKAALREKLQ